MYLKATDANLIATRILQERDAETARIAMNKALAIYTQLDLEIRAAASQGLYRIQVPHQDWAVHTQLQKLVNLNGYSLSDQDGRHQTPSILSW